MESLNVENFLDELTRLMESENKICDIKFDLRSKILREQLKDKVKNNEISIEYLCNRAIFEGNIKVVKWLGINYCMFDAMNLAVKYDNKEIFLWLNRMYSCKEYMVNYCGDLIRRRCEKEWCKTEMKILDYPENVEMFEIAKNSNVLKYWK